jgi:hypothetical protein
MANYQNIHARLNEENRFLLEERAAIMEYDGKMSRAEAEEKAAEEFIRERKEAKDAKD